MRAFPSRPLPAALVVLVVLAAPSVQASTRYSRQITVGSGMFLGLMRDRAQKGAVSVTTLDGKPLGRLTYAGSFVEFQAKGTYNLEFEQDDFDLNFALVKSRESTGAYMLNVARSGKDSLKTKGGWEGDQEARVTVSAVEGTALIVVD
jgi:hypothetical protein